MKVVEVADPVVAVVVAVGTVVVVAVAAAVVLVRKGLGSSTTQVLLLS